MGSLYQLLTGDEFLCNICQNRFDWLFKDGEILVPPTPHFTPSFGCGFFFVFCFFLLNIVDRQLSSITYEHIFNVTNIIYIIFMSNYTNYEKRHLTLCIGTISVLTYLKVNIAEVKPKGQNLNRAKNICTDGTSLLTLSAPCDLYISRVR